MIYDRLDMGFEPQIRRIVESEGMPKDRQTFMFSATFPVEIQRLAGDFMGNYIFVAVGRVGSASKDVTQKIEWVEQNDKVEFVIDFLSRVPEGLVLIFVETKRGADYLEEVLTRYNFPASSIHGDKSQKEREDALKCFKSGRTPILVATDVAARGLDIPNVTQVINFDLPSNIDDYVHRIGRTGRVGNTGNALSLINDKNRNIAKDLLALLVENQQEIPPFMEKFYSTSGDNYQNSYSGRGGGRGYGRGRGNARFGARDYRVNNADYNTGTTYYNASGGSYSSSSTNYYNSNGSGYQQSRIEGAAVAGNYGTSARTYTNHGNQVAASASQNYAVTPATTGGNYQQAAVVNPATTYNTAYGATTTPSTGYPAYGTNNVPAYQANAYSNPANMVNYGMPPASTSGYGVSPQVGYTNSYGGAVFGGYNAMPNQVASTSAPLTAPAYPNSNYSPGYGNAVVQQTIPQNGYEAVSSGYVNNSRQAATYYNGYARQGNEVDTGATNQQGRYANPSQNNYYHQNNGNYGKQQYNAGRGGGGYEYYRPTNQQPPAAGTESS